MIEDSVRLGVARPPEPPATPEELEFITYGRRGRFTRLNVDRTSALLERDDVERYGRRRP